MIAPLDPRPNLDGSVFWTRLLAAAHRRDGDDPRGLFGVLHYLRRGGARLHLEFGSARLDAGEIPATEYAALRSRYLLPRADGVRSRLAGVGVPRTTDHIAPEADGLGA